MARKVGPVVALMTYFGRHPNQTAAEFVKEAGELGDDKISLAQDAADELGITLDLS